MNKLQIWKKKHASYLLLCVFSENSSLTCQNKGVLRRFCLFNETSG